MNNALKYVKILENVGLAREQAEAHIQVLTDFLEDDLATKTDFHNLNNRINDMEKRLDTKIDLAVERLEHKIVQLEYRMTIKLGSIVTVVMAAFTCVIKFL